MQVNRRLLVLVILLVSVSVLAQSEDDAAKEKRARLNAILEESLADVQSLRLPENRAVFYARIGNLMWAQDEKRARALFLNAATELVDAQTFAESKRAQNPYSDLIHGGGTRQTILNTIANRDAQLALELLVKTRPAAVQRAIETGPDRDKKISNYHQNTAHLAQNESYMEQNFYRMAAEQSPERAAKILKESMTKGLSSETFNQLTRLADKDPVAAGEMASQIVDRLLRSNYMFDEQPNYVNIQLTHSILGYQMSRQNGDGNKLKFDDSRIRDLASKFVNTYVSDPRVAPSIGAGILAVAEKLAPSSVEQVKKMNARMNPQTGNTGLDTAYQKLMENDTSVERMLAEADKFPMSTRRQIYQTASNKLMNQGDWEGAREILRQNFDGDDYTISNFDSQLVYNLIGQGKFSEAERIIDGMQEQMRIGMLVHLSSTTFNRDQKENRAQALAVLGKARQLTNERPENSNELSMLMQVIGGYSQVDPAEAIRLYEGIIPKLVELTDASAVLNGFQLNSNVREGEFIMLNGDLFSQYGGNPSVVTSFAKFDFDRTMQMIDSFGRQEIRVSLRLQLLDGSELNASVPITSKASVSIRTGRGDK